MTTIDIGLGTAVGVGNEVGVKVALGIGEKVREGTGERVVIKTLGGSKEGVMVGPMRWAAPWQPAKKTIRKDSNNNK
jgi:hypothetical protein